MHKAKMLVKSGKKKTHFAECFMWFRRKDEVNIKFLFQSEVTEVISLLFLGGGCGFSLLVSQHAKWVNITTI